MISSFSSHSGLTRRIFRFTLLALALMPLLVVINRGRSETNRATPSPLPGGGGHTLQAADSHLQKSQSVETDALWSDTAGLNLSGLVDAGEVPKGSRTLMLEQVALDKKLGEAPLEFTRQAERTKTIISLPVPNGRLSRFTIQESPVLSAELSAKFPGITTYRGQGLDDETATTRISWSANGLSAIVISEEGTFQVVPVLQGGRRLYVSYFTYGLDPKPFECFTQDASQGDGSAAPMQINAAIANGSLRKYSLAVSVTPNFIEHIGGEVNPGFGTVDAVAKYINNVRAIYEREVGSSFNVVAIIQLPFNYTDPELGSMNDSNQSLFDNPSILGNSYYDLGLGLGWANEASGLARLAEPGSACQSFYKAQSSALVTGPASNDYKGSLVIAHELGHMFGARHTFKATPGTYCAPRADALVMVEPGSGSTIMSYAGICGGENLLTGNPLDSMDGYFHFNSLNKIANHKTSFSACGETVATGNSAPTISNGGANATIPAFTPFTLTAAASDPNGDKVTYSWEQNDVGNPLFRSYAPSSSPSRTFPSLTYVLYNGNFPPYNIGSFRSGEELPGPNQTMNFSVVVRDNRLGGGVTARDTLLQVKTSGSGPFRVTQPNSAVTLQPNTQLTITWDVAGSNSGLVSTPNVRIRLSTDGGNSFPTVLLDSTPNDGSQALTVPNVSTSAGRIKIEAVGNIFFDVSDVNFTINGSGNGQIPATRNLTPVGLPGWSDRIVLSTMPGNNLDNGPLRSSDTIYADFAVINSGTASIATSFDVKLLVDDLERQTFTASPPLGVASFAYLEDYSLGSLSPGSHTIKIIADSGGTVSESSESDNEYTKTFTVVGPSTTFALNGTLYPVSEGDKKATITVIRSGDTSGSGTVDYTTVDGSANQVADYTIAAGTLHFGPGETTKTFSVLITDDLYLDGDRFLYVVLDDPSGVATFNYPYFATILIFDNDVNPPTTNPLDQANAEFFVRQHYLDFLNRESDSGGLSYWTSRITSCGTNQSCRNEARIDVSNAFFYELEFQQTGSYVYRLYRAAFGNNQPFPNPDSGNPSEARKLPSYSAFSNDRARVVGGASLAQGQLDLANSFVQRAPFLTSYPTSLTGAAFVDSLLSTMQNQLGVNLSSQRTALINLHNSAGRGAVLYRLADDNLTTNPINNRSFIDAEYNRAFVATQYFGYLRRNPDMGGFIFWLGQVNGAPLRNVPRQHAMVCSFITSVEFQRRFSSVSPHSNAECAH